MLEIHLLKVAKEEKNYTFTIILDEILQLYFVLEVLLLAFFKASVMLILLRSSIPTKSLNIRIAI